MVFSARNPFTACLGVEIRIFFSRKQRLILGALPILIRFSLEKYGGYSRGPKKVVNAIEKTLSSERENQISTLKMMSFC